MCYLYAGGNAQKFVNDANNFIQNALSMAAQVNSIPRPVNATRVTEYSPEGYYESYIPGGTYTSGGYEYTVKYDVISNDPSKDNSHLHRDR